MEYGLPHLALDDFDPMSVLIEDAVHFEGPELVYDFIDALMTSQRAAVSADCGASSSAPIAIPNEGGFSKRHKRVDSYHIGSPVSTMDYSSDIGDGPPLKPLPSHDGQRSPQRSHGGVGLSRKNRPQRCSICKECGHKSRTCRFAQGKVDLRPGSPDTYGSIALQTSSY